MDSQTIQLWINSLGLGFAELVAKGTIPNQPLIKPFGQSNWLTMHPVAGVELVFKDETNYLEQVLITLISTVGQPVYTADLPAPFTLNMNQRWVRSVLGEPMETKGPAKLPGGLGMRGGWDAYRLSTGSNLSAKVTFGYLESLAVNNIGFSLLKPGHY